MTRLFLALVLSASAICFSLDPPKFDPRHKLVTDLTGTLTPAQVQQLQSKLQQIEMSDSTEIAVLMIPSLQKEELFNYTQKVFQTWGIGQKEKNNGVLFLIAKNDRKARIHAGYGLEGRLPDALAFQILTDEVLPEFRQNRYYEGLDRGANTIVKAVRGEYQAKPAVHKKGGTTSVLIKIWVLILFAGFVWVLLQMRRARYADPTGFGGFAGPSLPGVGPFPMGGMGEGRGRDESNDDNGPGNFGGGESGGGGAESNW